MRSVYLLPWQLQLQRLSLWIACWPQRTFNSNCCWQSFECSVHIDLECRLATLGASQCEIVSVIGQTVHCNLESCEGDLAGASAHWLWILSACWLFGAFALDGCRRLNKQTSLPQRYFGYPNFASEMPWHYGLWKTMNDSRWWSPVLLVGLQLFMSQPSVLFELKCQKFVEMVCQTLYPLVQCHIYSWIWFLKWLLCFMHVCMCGGNVLCK
jgi:hypothetical protein